MDLKKELKDVFSILSIAYSRLPPTVGEELGVSILARSIKDDSFFELDPEDQCEILRRMVTLHIGRGEMFYRLEKDGMINPHFWSRFKKIIDDFIEDLVGKSYPFPKNK